MGKRKYNRSTTKNKKKKPDLSNLVVDTEAYEVEQIIEQKLVKREVHYFLKWVGYPHEENTWECENRLMSPKVLLDFARNCSDATYNDNISNTLRKVGTMSSSDFMKYANHLSISAINYYQMGSIQFMSSDSIGSKQLMLQSAFDNDHEWIMRTITNCSESEVTRDFKKYLSELDFRIQSSVDYPSVAVCYDRTWNTDSFVPPPPPLSNLIFSPILRTDVTLKNYGNIIVGKSSTMGFDGTQVFSDPEIFKAEKSPLFSHVTEDCSIFKYRERFTCLFTLQYMSEDIGWGLTINHAAKKDTALMQMCGVISPITAALEAYQKRGEIVTFPNFVAIGDSGYCLDRSRYYDFSKFIQHSCEPNCCVRLSKSDRNDIKDLSIFAKKKIDPGETLSIDYFKCFEADVLKFFADCTDDLMNEDNGQVVYLSENRIDHILCHCRSDKCRKILYIEQCDQQITPETTKLEKLKKTYAKTPFYGLYLLESDEVYVFDPKE